MVLELLIAEDVVELLPLESGLSRVFGELKLELVFCKRVTFEGNHLHCVIISIIYSNRIFKVVNMSCIFGFREVLRRLLIVRFSDLTFVSRALLIEEADGTFIKCDKQIVFFKDLFIFYSIGLLWNMSLDRMQTILLERLEVNVEELSRRWWLNPLCFNMQC